MTKVNEQFKEYESLYGEYKSQITDYYFYLSVEKGYQAANRVFAKKEKREKRGLCGGRE